MDQQKVVLFDLGGVLVESAGRLALHALLPHLKDEGVVLQRWHESEAVGLFERGLISREEFARAFVREWELAIDESHFLESFALWVRGFFDGAEQLIHDLRRKHRVGCLSNTNAVHWERLPQVTGLFDYRFASHLAGFMKPAPEAYSHALHVIGVDGRDVYFLDDLVANVLAAREAGINAFHVRGLAEAEAALLGEGLLARPPSSVTGRNAPNPMH